MDAVQDIQNLETVERDHGAECFCQICKPQIVDEQSEEPIRIYIAE